MKKPYVICHMMSSVDGRPLTAQWGKMKGMDNYEETGNSHKADAWMCGRITMERDFAEKEPLKLKKAIRPVNREDSIDLRIEADAIHHNDTPQVMCCCMY